jgi:hypothetical protein
VEKTAGIIWIILNFQCYTFKNVQAWWGLGWRFWRFIEDLALKMNMPPILDHESNLLRAV